ncbi:MAG: MOSC domain-containing protein [Gemmatimonadaceae bacterium]|nr:MOSC domain-containing protein [Gemmatimonadaceae bacterium]
MEVSPTLMQLNVSWGGMPKLPVEFARVTRAGVEGDYQKNRKYHGGPDRAVCLLSHELYEWLRQRKIDLKYGSVGENFTTRGIDLNVLEKGDRLKVGECVVELTDVRIPCKKLKQWDPDLPGLMVGCSGWVARVLEEAIVRTGDPVELLEASNLKSQLLNR